MCLTSYFNSIYPLPIKWEFKTIHALVLGMMVFSLQFIVAQIENNNPSFSFPSNESNNSNPLFQPPAEEKSYLKGDFMDKIFDMTDPALNDKGPKINMDNQEEFLNPGDIYLSKIKGKGVEAGKDPNKYRTNQYMGDYRIEGNQARIIFRDHESPDGDRIRILHNDKIIKPNTLLIERFVGLIIELVPGFNKIDFIALNQGSSGPNTAEVRVYDEKGDITAADQWNLATGSKATYILIKE